MTAQQGPFIRRLFRWPDKYATPAWSVRCRLNRCEAGPWLCWRPKVEDWPMAACERHVNSDLMKLGGQEEADEYVVRHENDAGAWDV